MNTKLDGRFIDNLGRVVMTVDGLSDLIVAGKEINGLLAEECDDTIKYNKYGKSNLVLYTEDMMSETADVYDENAVLRWKTPTEYNITDEELINWLFEQCSSDVEYERIIEELNMYDDRGLYPLLKHLIYLVDHFRKNDIVWGVGRGSSVSSFVLFLIGIHKVNPLTYELDIKDFLK
jgi:DNA polymerase III alpha subunit